jgi:hypothetical protein
MTDSAPLSKTIEATVPAATKEATQDQVIGEVPFDGTVTAVSIVPEANGTAHATNFRTFTVRNKGAAGSGSTAIATLATDTPTTDDLKAFDEKALTLTATAADREVASGDVIAVVETVAAEGLAHSGYKVQVEITRS